MGFLDAWDGVDLLVLTITTTVASTYAAGDVSYYPTTLTTSIQPSSTTLSTGNTTDGSSSTSGLPIQSKIALGIGLGIGFPSLMISAILFCIKLREIRRENRERQEVRSIAVGREGVGMGVSVNHSKQKPE